MNSLLNISKSFEKLNRTVARFAVWLILVLMIVIVTDVTLRRWFVIGSTKLQELEWHLHGALFLLCLGWAYTKNVHVRIELVSENFSDRASAYIELLGGLLFLMPFCAAILYFGYDYIAFSLSYNEASASATGLSDRWIIKSMVVVGFLLLMLAAIARTLEAIVFLFGEDSAAQKTRYAQKSANAPLTTTPGEAT